MIVDIFKNKKYYKIQYPKYEELGTELIPRIEDYIQQKGPKYFQFWKMKNGGLTCYPQDLINENWADLLDDVNNFTVNHAKLYCNEIGYYKGKEPYVKNQWFTYYPANAYFDYHRHTGVIVTAVLYLRKPVDGGNLLLCDNQKGGIIEEVEIPVEEGDLLFFPGYLNHKSQPNLTNSLRSTISTDISFKR